MWWRNLFCRLHLPLHRIAMKPNCELEQWRRDSKHCKCVHLDDFTCKCFSSQRLTVSNRARRRTMCRFEKLLMRFTGVTLCSLTRAEFCIGLKFFVGAQTTDPGQRPKWSEQLRTRWNCLLEECAWCNRRPPKQKNDWENHFHPGSTAKAAQVWTRSSVVRNSCE